MIYKSANELVYVSYLTIMIHDDDDNEDGNSVMLSWQELMSTRNRLQDPDNL